MISQPAEKAMANSVMPFNTADLKYCGAINSSSNLNTLSDGVYYITDSPPENAPASYAVWSVLFQITPSSSMIHQYIIRPYSGVIWMREHSGNPSYWTAWKKWEGVNV